MTTPADLPIDDLSAVRARAATHERELRARVSFLTVRDLAARWGVCEATVRAIPRERLPWTPIGRGAQRVHRRYDPAAVARYEHGTEDAA